VYSKYEYFSSKRKSRFRRKTQHKLAAFSEKSSDVIYGDHLLEKNSVSRKAILRSLRAEVTKINSMATSFKYVTNLFELCISDQQ
jgi:hypothetical protein